MPVFKVESRRGGKPRVVEAVNSQSARLFVARDEFTIGKITTRDAFMLSAEGVELETAGEAQPEPQPASE